MARLVRPHVPSGPSRLLSLGLVRGINLMAQKKDDAKDETMTTRQAGKMGGDKVKAERGPEFYSEIGRMQGADVNPGNFKNRDPKEVRDAAEKGGKTRGQQIHEAVERAHEMEDEEKAA